MSDKVTTPPPVDPSAVAAPPFPPAAGQPANAQFDPSAPGAGPVAGDVLATAKPAKSRGWLKFALRIVIVPVVLLVGGLVWSLATGDPELAKQGDCLLGQNADDMKIVGCDDATAEWTVVGKIDNVREETFNASEEDTSCTGYPTATASFWSGTKGGNGDVLCLEPITK